MSYLYISNNLSLRGSNPAHPFLYGHEEYVTKLKTGCGTLVLKLGALMLLYSLQELGSDDSAAMVQDGPAASVQEDPVQEHPATPVSYC